MPARKPAALINRHETAEEKTQRAERESALRPSRRLPSQAPAQLAEHPSAAAAWRRLMRVYGELEGEIVTRLDQDLLIDYCLLVEQIVDMDVMRRSAKQAWLLLDGKRQKLQEAGQIDEAVVLAAQAVGASDMVLRLDARCDQKRKTLHQYRQSLYLTPRARAGAAPAKKEMEPPPDELEQLLDDVTQFVNEEGHGS